MKQYRFTPDSLPAMPGLLLRAALKRSTDRAAPELPATRLQCLGMPVAGEKQQAYHRLLPWPHENKVHPAWIHCLAMPLHLGLLLDKAFVFRVMGLVHMENQITQYRAIGLDEHIDIQCECAALTRHRLGWQFDIVTKVHVGSELVWEGKSTSLARQGQVAAKRIAVARPAANADQIWHLEADLGRRYARVSGDYNPIHLYAWSARLFGFKAPIIHGMWSKARCISALAHELGHRFSVSVSFRKPVLLPCDLGFVSQPQRFSLVSADGLDTHLTGRFERLSATTD